MVAAMTRTRRRRADRMTARVYRDRCRALLDWRGGKLVYTDFPGGSLFHDVICLSAAKGTAQNYNTTYSWLCRI